MKNKFVFCFLFSILCSAIYADTTLDRIAAYKSNRLIPSDFTLDSNALSFNCDALSWEQNSKGNGTIEDNKDITWQDVLDANYQCPGWIFPENMDCSAISIDKKGNIPDFSGCDFSKVGDIDFQSLFITENDGVIANFDGIIVTRAQYDSFSSYLTMSAVANPGSIGNGASSIFVIEDDGQQVEYLRHDTGGQGRYRWVAVHTGGSGMQ